MKKLSLVVITMLLSLHLFLNAEDEKDSKSLLNVKTQNEVLFSNGYGVVRATPILQNKELESEVVLIGEYNVDKATSNANINFDKVEIRGNIYNLNNPFVKKGRLSDPNAVMKQESLLTVEGGNKQELLDLLNAVEQEENNPNKTQEKSIAEKIASSIGNTGTNANGEYGGYTPSTLTDSDSDDEDSSKNYVDPISTNVSDNGTTVVSCPLPTFKNGIATYYEVVGLSCIERKTNSVETIYNSDSCINKVDYVNNTIELGYELMAHSTDGGSYLVQNCKYKEPIELKSEIASCNAIPDYVNLKGELQKQYYYNYENKKTNVGECTPSGEMVNLQYDINECSKDRHDFEKNVSVAQGLYYYSVENKNYDLGDCVDIPQYTYSHYADDTTCNYDIVDDRVFYRERVAYTDLIGVKQFATDCQVTQAGGIEIIEEFAGYNYFPNTKQAIRVINNYFIVPNTNKKIYIDENVQTSKSYQYNESQCNLVNNDDTKTTTFYKEISFEDTDENVKVTVQECTPDQVIGYTQLSGTGQEEFIGSLGMKQLYKDTDKFYFLDDEDLKVYLTPYNGLYPSDKSDSENITNLTKIIVLSQASIKCHSEGTHSVVYDTCVSGDILNINKSYIYKLTYLSQVSRNCKFEDKTMNYTEKICNYWQYYEEVAKYRIQATYLRGDGTTYDLPAEDFYQIIK